MSDLFVYGTLGHPALLRAVIGRVPERIRATLPGHAVRKARGEVWPLLVPGAEGAAGILVARLGAEEFARLRYYEEAFGFRARQIEVTTSRADNAPALAFFAPPGIEPDGPWTLGRWATRWGDTAASAAADMLREFGRRPPAEAARRYTQHLIRGGARVRAAAETRPTALRYRAAEADVEVAALRVPYQEYFSVEERDLRFRRFDGRMSEPLSRAVFISGDAAVVLPYDPVRDRVMVIEQFRAGPHARGDGQPWLIEAIAGRVDGGESPEDAALREAREEAGIAISRLVPAARYYPSPAAKAEYLYTYIGLADLPDGSAGVAGMPGEGEDIRSHLLPYEGLMQLVETGEIDNAPLIILALRLARMRPALRRTTEPGA
ncbi:MAG: NUDIX domain-containing protein [Paracoccaceae bacterium]